MDERPPEARPLVVLVATGLGLFMIFLDATIVNVAVPEHQQRRRDAAATDRGTMLVITQYFQNIRDYSAEEAGFLMSRTPTPVRSRR